MLIGIDFFDELASGLPAAGAPELRLALGAGVASLTVAIFTTPLVLSFVVDVPLLLWAERRSRSRMLALGLLGMGLSLLAAAFATSVVGFGLAFALYAPASGLACGLAQASLMDGEPEQRERNMAAWTLSGTLGDLCAPVAIAGAVALSGDHRLAWWVVGLGLVLLAPFIALRPLPSARAGDDDAPAEPLWKALRNRELVLWLFGVSLCGPLDELFAAYAALSLRERFPSDPAMVTKALTACTVGGILGLVALRRLLVSVRPTRLLALACAGSVVAYAAWLRTSSATLVIVWIAVVGAFVSWHYPLAQAGAYRAAADRSGLIAALSPAVTSFEWVAPFILGLVAERFGLGTALALLLAQPIGLVVVIASTRTPKLNILLGSTAAEGSKESKEDHADER